VSKDGVTLAMSLSLDSDGFLSSECPTCVREFKWPHQRTLFLELVNPESQVGTPSKLSDSIGEIRMELGHRPVETLVGKLIDGEIVLPDIQREYVWSGAQIPRLLDSLNKQWPVGSILLWRTNLDIPTKTAAIVQDGAVGVQTSILLDGQQRLSTLARVMEPSKVPKGQKAPDVRFHPGTSEFKNVNAVQRRDPHWIPVSAILAKDAQYRDLLKPLGLEQSVEDQWTDVLAGVAKRIREYLLPVQTIDIDDYETVAEIFNRVNTGGTRLSKGDLVMGAMAARWPNGRQAIEDFEQSLRSMGWGLNREVLLRIMSVIKLNSPNHTRLVELKAESDWSQAWQQMQHYVLDAVAFFKDDAGIMARSLLPTEYVVLLPTVFLHDRKGQFRPGEAEELARWMLLASAFGHYSGSLETTLAADINLLRSKESAGTPEATLPALIGSVQEPRTPGARITADDLKGRTRKSPFLRLLQIRATQKGAQSWVSNRAITWDPNHNGLSVEVHHIFPQAWMRKQKLAKHPELDTLSNFAFLSKWDNIRISDENPADYLVKADKAVLAAQWIPLDEDLWATERFADFCAARRDLMADSINEMLGLRGLAGSDEPLDSDESPEVELGAWAEDVVES